MQGHKPRASVRIVAVVSLGIAFVIGGAPAAPAATYDVWTCANAHGAPLGASDWQTYAFEIISSSTSSCGTSSAPGRLSAQSGLSTYSGVPNASGHEIAAPPDTVITGLDIWWAHQAGDGRSTSIAATLADYRPPPCRPGSSCPPYPGALYARGGSFGSFTSTPAQALSDINLQMYRGFRATAVRIAANCTSACTTPVLAARYEAYRVHLLVDDDSAPIGTASSLTDGDRVSSPLTVSVAAGDRGGGVRDVSLRVNTTVVDRVAAGGECTDVDSSNTNSDEYASIKPCPPGLVATLTLNPRDLMVAEPAIVSVVATDAAGQETTLATARMAPAAPAGFHIDSVGFVNPDLDLRSPRRTNGAGSGAAKATLSFVVHSGKHRRARASRVVRAGVSALVRARFVDSAGQPIAGARVWRAAAVNGDQWRIFGAPLTTSRKGRVAAKIPPNQPSRRIALVYFPFSDSNATVQSPARWLRVRAATTFSVPRRRYRNGNVLRFSGRIATRPVKPGQVVLVQALLRGKWQEFTHARANSRGRWIARRRFDASPVRTVFTFRALVIKPQRGYPFETGHSPRIHVVINP